ncbi:MAG: radical SAM protein [Flavonifractor plautii]
MRLLRLLLPGGEGGPDGRLPKGAARPYEGDRALTRGWQVDTVYFGGGTPSFYGEKRLREVLKNVAKRFDLAKDAEITVECNPDSVDKKVFQALRRAGVNRISLGVQSAHDCELNCLHRPHTFQQAQRAVAAAREAKIKNISLDLIYGLPNQDMAGWRDTVEQVLELEPEHLSCYGLKVEPGTPRTTGWCGGRSCPTTTSRRICIFGR